ncbi:hypothetical protein GDO78_005702 [Eleutherodactylus coqui]|uniref:Uncharacterized protein n=1 Tax=Eleutherodactylus coqui TaxID=57060 RepID=A0A8J6FL00_ELECQ|nr:hypothetical protein GDO78_005702 [Eleutherodactylus coqui]
MCECNAKSRMNASYGHHVFLISFCSECLYKVGKLKYKLTFVKFTFRYNLYTMLRILNFAHLVSSNYIISYSSFTFSEGLIILPVPTWYQSVILRLLSYSLLFTVAFQMLR